MRFRAVVRTTGKTAAGIEVPEEIVAALGSGRAPRVRVCIGDHTYRSTVARRGNRFLLGVSAENRARAGVAPGDDVDVELELDTAPREIVVPADLAEAFVREPRARDFFATLTYSQKQWYVLPIEQAKTPETRERRMLKAITMLLAGRKR